MVLCGDVRQRSFLGLGPFLVLGSPLFCLEKFLERVVWPNREKFAAGADAFIQNTRKMDANQFESVYVTNVRYLFFQATEIQSTMNNFMIHYF